MRDVAVAAGVNQSTVSRALRNDPRICPGTRVRIQELALRMRYRANPFVTAFTTHVRNHRVFPHPATIAILELTPASWAKRYKDGIAERADRHGFCVDELRPDTLPNGLWDVNRIIQARGIRGLIVMPIHGDADLAVVDFSLLASATIDLNLRRPSVHRTSPDYVRGMVLALDTLHSRGYRRIGFCSSRFEVDRIGLDWLGGYLAWNNQHPSERPVQPHFCGYDGWNPDDAVLCAKRWKGFRDSFERWLSEEEPDAIVSNDFYYETWLGDLGIRIPSGMGFASLGLEATPFSCAGIDQRREQVGAAAIDLVAGQIYRNEYGVPSIPTTVLVPPVWAEGATVRRTDARRVSATG